MKVRFKKTYNYETQIIKLIEKVSESLILLNISLLSNSVKLDSRPLHKRYEFGDFPPLDIAFDSETGMLKEITIFINKENISNHERNRNVDLVYVSGYPSFILDMLEKHEFYYDEVCQVEISSYESTLHTRLLNEEVDKIVEVNDSLDILLNDRGEFVGFSYNELTENDLEMLQN